MKLRSLAVLMAALAPYFVGCSVAERPDGPRVGEVEEDRHPGGVTFRFAQRADADGTIPPNALMRAKRQRDTLLGSSFLAARGGPTNWEWLGPGNVGGRLRAVLIHPTNPSIIWVASASGGVWKTVNGGALWQPLDDYPSSLIASCMVMDPTDPDHLWLGTGEGYFDSVPGTSNTAAVRGAGIFESTDGGQTWNQVPSTANASWYFVNRLVIHPTNPALLLAATGSGIWRSIDGGQSWSRRTTARTFDLKMHPTNPLELVAGRADGVALYSVDGGLTYRNATGISGGARIELAYAPSNPLFVYANVTVPARGIMVFRSTDGGRTYSLRTRDANGIQTWSNYNSTIWVDPTNQGRIVFAGVRIYKSVDGGLTRTDITNGVHVDFHALVEDRRYNGSSNTTLYTGCDGGIYRTSNPFANSPQWTGLNNNLGVTQFYGAGINPTTGVIVGGTQDNGTIRFDGANPQGWTRTFGGDGGFSAADPTNTQVFYGEVQRLRIFRSTDGGNSARYIYNGSSNRIVEARPNFIPYFMLDPNNQNRMLACGAALWRSNDCRSATNPNWFIIKPSLGCLTGGDPAHFQDNPLCNISTCDVAPGDSDTVWVGHNNGNIYKSTNGTAGTPSWSRIDIGGGSVLPNRWVSRIEIDPRDNDRVYVSFMGYASNNVWRTLDGGLTWASVSGTGPFALPDIPVPCITVHPVVSGFLFAATDLGLFWSGDDGATWQTADDGPGLVTIDELIWQRNRLVAVTHGRGIYRAEVSPASAVAVGVGCGITRPVIMSASRPLVGATQTYLIGFASPNSLASMLFAPGGPSPTDLGNGCTLQIPTLTAFAVAINSTDSTGTTSYALPIPIDTHLVGAHLTAQAFVAVAGGPALGVGELSGGIEMYVGF